MRPLWLYPLHHGTNSKTRYVINIHVAEVHFASGFTIINAVTGNILIKAIVLKGNVVF